METPIFNFINRQQVYVEGVKNWYHQDFKRYLKLVADAVSAYLKKLNVKSLGELNATKLRALMRRVSNRIGEILTNYGVEFTQELKRFTFIDTRLNKGAWSIFKPKADIDAATGTSVWNKVKEKVVPAFGQTIPKQLTDFVAVAKDKITRRINTGAANNEDLTDTDNQITNLTTRTFSSIVQQVGNSARSIISTAFQHATATTSDFFGSILYDCYQWVSVMDSRTSETCRDLNGQEFRHGAGPVPPAHNHCRSRTVPVNCGEALAQVPTVFNWLLTQTEGFISDAFGASVGKKFANGSLLQGNVPEWQAIPAISLDDFETKGKFLTE